MVIVAQLPFWELPHLSQRTGGAVGGFPITRSAASVIGCHRRQAPFAETGIQIASHAKWLLQVAPFLGQ